MTTNDSHAWWSRLRHQGLLLSPVVLLERYPSAPPAAHFRLTERLRDAATKFRSVPVGSDSERAALAWIDALLEGCLGPASGRISKQNDLPEKLTAVVRFGSRTETIRPQRVVYADAARKVPALLIGLDDSAQVGRGRGRSAYAKFLELLRGTGQRLGLLTNGRQFRLLYAGLDFEAWSEWESDRWFDDGEGTDELAGLRQLLSLASLQESRPGVSGLLDAVEESRKRQADLSNVLRENVRQAVEILLEEVSAANQTNPLLFNALVDAGEGRRLTDVEAHEHLLQAAVRTVMRLVVCLFAESRQLLPVEDPIYAASYGVRSLYELLEESARDEGSHLGLMGRQTAWPRLMALFRLIHGGSEHHHFTLPAYRGSLFRPGAAHDPDPVSRALHVLEYGVSVSDAAVAAVLRKLLRGPLPVIRGRTKTFVEGPVDYTDLRTEFIGLIYEGLLDYRLKRTDAATGPQVFLDLGRQPVLPLGRLEDMLRNDPKGLKNLLTTLRKEAPGGAAEGSEAADEEEEPSESEAEAAAEEPLAIECDLPAEPASLRTDHLDALFAARRWAAEAIALAGLLSKQGKKESDADYRAKLDREAEKLVKRVAAVGEFYLVRAGNTRKGTGTFYTRPQLAVPTVHRTLEPLCYDKDAAGRKTPKTPEEILGLKVCDPACGSASFLTAALHYLTEALYRSLCVHRGLDHAVKAAKITLPYGRPRTNADGEELVPFAPNDPQRGDEYPERVKARLRRHVVERCLYGVDINPMAVEFARVSLWVETLDRDLPFSFLDHKIKVGNALVGCRLDRFSEYPLCAWEREGGDGKTGARTRRLETYLKGPLEGAKRSGDGVVKKEMRTVIRDQFRSQRNLFPDPATTALDVLAAARHEYEALHDLPELDPDVREAFYRTRITESPAVQRLKAAMDEWCAVWFWPADEESLKHVPTPATFHRPNRPETAALVQRIRATHKFFHWELEYPDVFTPDRRGFDAALGNPPWDVMKPISQEFFSDFDPLYRTYNKQEALRRQELAFTQIEGVLENWEEYNANFKAMSNWAGSVSEPFAVSLTRGAEEKTLQSAWELHRRKQGGFADPKVTFRLQGSADLNSYKMFTEWFWHLLQPEGRLGILLPTGIYSDFGTKELRKTLLHEGRIEFLYAFQNEKKVFSGVDHRFKQVVLVATRGGSTGRFLTRFRMGVGNSPHAQEIPEDLLLRDAAAMWVTPSDIERSSPKSLSLIELGSDRDREIFSTIYKHSFRIGGDTPGWEISYATEFHMTNDSKHFPAIEKWESKGYLPDAFGRWIGPQGDAALPVYQGRVIHQFDCWRSGYVHGAGRTAVWSDVSNENKQFQPQNLMSQAVFLEMASDKNPLRLVFRDIAPNTNTRTMIAAVVAAAPCNNKVPMLRLGNYDVLRLLFMSGCLNSLAFDFAVRNRMAGTTLNWFIVEECPMALVDVQSRNFGRIAHNAACLTFLHRRFAPDWLQLKNRSPHFLGREWKHWWAVKEDDRLRLRVEIDAMSADLYGLTPDDFDWIVRDDPTDSKGFYRVERNLPFRERLTGLSAAAFRALKEGKWSAESAATMSNDDFFDVLGIPELTAGSDPLIRKREGCHRWQPETFEPADPRYGWTWEHCQQDAVALLGSEEAVRKYVAGAEAAPAAPEPAPPASGKRGKEKGGAKDANRLFD